jgi:UDP-N-acetylglucosamine acyltransferase
MAQIHPMAVVDKKADLAADVVVGPFAYIGPQVRLGAGCVVEHHASIEGHTQAGTGNHFFPYCQVGTVPQDLKYRGGPCRVVIGDGNNIREHVTIHIGTEDGGGLTQVGNHNLLMIGMHVAHDCIIGDYCQLANQVLLAGHIVVEDRAVVAGGVAIHHFVTVGRNSFVGGTSGVVHDVPPFMVVNGHPAEVCGFNRTGLKRSGFGDAAVEAIRHAYRVLFKKGSPVALALKELEGLYPEVPEIQELVAFIRRSSDGKFGRYRESLREKAFQDSPDSTLAT